MQYLPTICHACRRVELLSTDACVEGQFKCTTCAGPAEVVPGCSYAEGDVALFEELSQIVASARISAAEAQRLAIDVERSSYVQKGHSAFAELTRLLPSLAPLKPTLDASSRRQRQAVVMLETILNAIAQRQRSGTLAALEPTDAEDRTGGAG
jgi:hypothetical protein